MLTMLLGGVFALAAGPVMPEPSEPDPCMLGVLMDWEQQRALAFPVSDQKEVDRENGVPLEVRLEEYAEHGFMWADVPFDNAFNRVAFVDEMDRQLVLGTVYQYNPFKVYMVEGERMDLHPVTIQGLTGYVEVLDGTPACNL